MMERKAKQQVEHLKTTLGDRLKKDFQDYKLLESKSAEQYAMYYEGAIGVLESMFNTLNRLGINIDE